MRSTETAPKARMPNTTRQERILGEAAMRNAVAMMSPAATAETPRSADATAGTCA